MSVCTAILTYLGQVLDIGTVLFEILLCAIGEHARRSRPMILSRIERILEFKGGLVEHFHRRFPIREVRGEAATSHALEAERQRAIDQPSLNETIGVVQCSATSGAVVVHVRNGNTSHAELV